MLKIPLGNGRSPLHTGRNIAMFSHYFYNDYVRRHPPAVGQNRLQRGRRRRGTTSRNCLEPSIKQIDRCGAEFPSNVPQTDLFHEKEVARAGICKALGTGARSAVYAGHCQLAPMGASNTATSGVTTCCNSALAS